MLRPETVRSIAGPSISLSLSLVHGFFLSLPWAFWLFEMEGARSAQEPSQRVFEGVGVKVGAMSNKKQPDSSIWLPSVPEKQSVD